METLDRIHENLIGSFNKEAHNALYREVARFNGCDASMNPIEQEYMPYFPELRQDVVKLGEAMDSVYAIKALMAKLRTRDVQPEFTDLDSDIIKRARTSLWQTRVRGTHDRDGWSSAHDLFTLWGIGFGKGCIEVGVKLDASGKTYIDHEFVSGYNVIFDRFAITPNQAEFAARVCYMPVWKFKKLYPKADPKTIQRRTNADTPAEFGDMARVVKYYSRSTFAVLNGDINGEELERRENVFERVMIAYMGHMPMPGAAEGVGLVQMMLPIQKAQNMVRKSSMEAMRNHGFTIFNQGAMDEELIQRLNSNDEERQYNYAATRMFDKDQKMYEQVPHQQVDPNALQVLSEMQRMWNPAASTNDYQMGNAASGVETLGEAQILNDSTEGQQSLVQSSYARAMEHLMDMTFHAMKEVDVAPINIAVDGNIVVINGDDPDTTMEALFEDPARPLIAEESLFSSDQDRKKMKRTNSLANLIPLAAQAGKSPEPIIKAIFDNEGFEYSSLPPLQPAPVDMTGQVMPQAQVPA